MNVLELKIHLNLIRILCDNNNEAHAPLLILHITGGGSEIHVDTSLILSYSNDNIPWYLDIFRTIYHRRGGQMKDPSKTNPQLNEDISLLKQRIIELEQSKIKHKETEAALRTSEAKFKEIFETTEDLYYETDSEGIVQLVSPSLQPLTGWNEEDVIGKPAASFYVYPHDREQLYVKLSEKGYIHDFEVFLKRKDGEERLASLSARLIIDDNGQPTGLRGLLRDITERKRTEEAIKESELRFRALFDSANDAIFIMKDRIIFDCNRKTLDMFCCSKEDIIICSPVDFSPEIQPDGLLSSEKATEKINMALKGIPQFFEWKHRRMNGTLFDTEVSLNSIELGGNTYLQAIVRDITKRKQAEEALEESESKFRDLAEKSVAGVYLVQDGMLKYVNLKLAQVLGYSIDEMIDKVTVEDVIFPEDWPMVEESYRKRISGEIDSLHYEFRIRTKDRQVKNAEVYSSRTIYQGRPAVIGTMLDITKRKQAEEALKLSEVTYREIFNTVNDTIWIHDIETGELLDVNDNVMEMFGYPVREAMGLSMEDISSGIPPFIQETVVELLRKVAAGEPQRFEWHCRHKDGHLFWSEVNLKRGIIAGKERILAIERDITEHKLAEEEITREREKLKTLSDNAPFGMVLIDKEGHFTYINRKFTELFGYELPDIPDGRTWCRKAYPDAEYRHTVISAWREDLRDDRPGERKPNVFTVTCKDGTQKIVHFIFSVLITGNSLMTCEDITELRQLENQLHQSQKMESIGTLAGGIAHDFNNILTVMTGYAALLKMKMDKSSPLRSYVDQVLLASQKAADLTQSLLAFSRQQPVNLVPVNMNHTVKVAEKLLRRLLTENIEFRTSLADDDTIVMADKSQMDQILFNLVANARDAMPKGGTLTIETAITTINKNFIKIHGFGEPGKYVQINISDTGIGMDEITQQKIFDPFFTTKEIGKGTGLGLATAYGIVKQNNGYITVDSAPNQGTTFHIFLPHIKMKVDEAEDTSTPITTGNETILIAEDDEEVRLFMREALQGHGYTIREATDGEDAIERFKEHRDMDLIIIDSVMPKKNGREAYEEIHRIDPHIKVLFTSGYTKDIFLDKGIEDGEFNFIAKPLLLDDLLWKVREVLDR